MIFYVYEHYRIGEDVPFFVGKGHHRRAYTKRGRNVWWKRIVEKSGGFEVRFVQENLSEFEAFWLEVNQIAGWGRADLGEGPLVNLTDGGEGVSGWIPTKEWRDKKRKMMKNNTISKGLKQSEEQCEGKRQRMLGNTYAEALKQTDEWKKQNSERVTKWWANRPEEELQAFKESKTGKNNPMYGTNRTNEQKQTQREAMKGNQNGRGNINNVHTIEHNNNIRNSLLGSKNPASRPVTTPLGSFDTITDAAKIHDMTVSGMAYRCKTNTKGCRYI